MKYTLGVDATNIRQGGGITHLKEFLSSLQYLDTKYNYIYVWGPKSTLDALPNSKYIIKKSSKLHSKSLIYRYIWQLLFLPFEIGSTKCNILFVPGGICFVPRIPSVLMCQNLLPFQFNELMRYGFSPLTFKYILLNVLQTLSFMFSDLVILLSNHSKNVLHKSVPNVINKSIVIPHGINPRFKFSNRIHRQIGTCSSRNPFKIIYVSKIDAYKHQCNVINAIYKLRKSTGWEINLTLVGPSHPKFLKTMNRLIANIDPSNSWIIYLGEISYDEMHQVYFDADVGLWASTCETFGLILLEKMAVGLPVASSFNGPNQDILSDAGVYFDPENISDITLVLKNFINNYHKRISCSTRAIELSKQYTWDKCCSATLKAFDFIHNLKTSSH